MQGSQATTDELQGHMTNVLMAQDYQDLTGQVIRRVIELVREVEDSLIHLLTVFGTAEEPQSKQKENIEEVQIAEMESAVLSGPEGPIMDAESREDVVSNLDEVADLLSSLGF